MIIKFRAKEKLGDLIIDSDHIKQVGNVFGGYNFYLWHICFTKEPSDKGMWIEIDPSTLIMKKEY